MRNIIMIMVIGTLFIMGCSTNIITPAYGNVDDASSWAWPFAYELMMLEKQYGGSYPITGVDPGSEIFWVDGDQSGSFPPGTLFEVSGSTGNDGDYSTVNSMYVDPVGTWINVNEDVTSAVADGTITIFTWVPGSTSEIWVGFYNNAADAWQISMVADDAIPGQMSCQRNSNAWSADGYYGLAYIDSGNDLNYMQNADGDWIPDGAWALLDDDASYNWISVDVESRQNYVWAVPFTTGNEFTYCNFIDLAAAVPNWTLNTIISQVMDNTHYSIALDKELAGYVGFVGILGGSVVYTYIHPVTPASLQTLLTTGATGDYPQILGNFASSIFFTDGNVLYFLSNVIHWALPEFETVYTATALTSDYHTAHCPADDTIHVALVDDGADLIHLDRNPNRWAIEGIDTAGMGEGYFSPLIQCDKFGNIRMWWCSTGLVNDYIKTCYSSDLGKTWGGITTIATIDPGMLMKLSGPDYCPVYGGD